MGLRMGQGPGRVRRGPDFLGICNWSKLRRPGEPWCLTGDPGRLCRGGRDRGYVTGQRYSARMMGLEGPEVAGQDAGSVSQIQDEVATSAGKKERPLCKRIHTERGSMMTIFNLIPAELWETETRRSEGRVNFLQKGFRASPDRRCTSARAPQVADRQLVYQRADGGTLSWIWVAAHGGRSGRACVNVRLSFA